MGWSMINDQKPPIKQSNVKYVHCNHGLANHGIGPAPPAGVDPLGENPAVTETGSWICNCVWQIHPARAIRRNPLIAAVSDDGHMSGIGLDWIGVPAPSTSSRN